MSIKNSLCSGKKNSANWFKIANKIHQKVSFKQHNLIEPNKVSEKKFDLILCRNVLIYFKPETIKGLMTKLHDTLQHGGHLFIGHSESIPGTSNLFKSLQPSVFNKKAV